MAQHEIQYVLKLPKHRRAVTQPGLPEKIEKQTPVSLELPRITRLIALAIKFDGLLDSHSPSFLARKRPRNSQAAIAQPNRPPAHRTASRRNPWKQS